MPLDNPTQKAVALKNSRPLDIHRWSEDHRVNNAVDALHQRFKSELNFSGNKRLNKNHIKFIVLDLYANWLEDNERFVYFSRSRNGYKAKSRYNALGVSQLTIRVVDAFKDLKLIEYYPGFYDPKLEIGSRARIKATDQLITLLRDEFEIPASAIGRCEYQECIILRDKIKDEKGKKAKKVEVEYEDTEETKRMREVLTAYNQLLARSEIAIPTAPEHGVPNKSETRYVKPVETAKFTRRIFNNGTWDEGGRFYGGWWQQISSDWRKKISINRANNRSIELDYSGHHIVLLYALEGIDYWKEEERGPYAIDDLEETERMRSLLKLVLLIAINAKDRKTALRAIRSEINSDSDSYGWLRDHDLDLNGVIDAFVGRHEPIAKYFFSNRGIRLQNMDAKIAEEVINHFTRQEVPVLCVHDSFVISPAHEDELREVMTEAIRRVVREEIDKDLDITPRLK